MKSPIAAAVLPLVLITAACGFPNGEPQDGAPSSSDIADAALNVTAAFYPLQWVSERVGGDLVSVTGLTKPGAEPHDLELTPKAVAELASSDVVVYLKSFQPAVDEAVQTRAVDSAFDVGPDAQLDIPVSPNEHTDEEPPKDDHAGSVMDPHFWLDPLRLKQVATAVGDRFAAADPANAQTYRANSSALGSDLDALNGDFEKGLSTCASKDLVTSHRAFAYLAARYGLSQEGIAGLSPDAEPDAATIRDIVEHVKEDSVTTIYSETLVSPALAETIASESGARVAVLDPIEGLTDGSAGDDYLEVMRSNLKALEQGQQCS